MMTLITYDIDTTTAEARKRLRLVAKKCVNYGQRVQNSVFEMNMDYGSFIRMKAELLKIIDKEKDSIRFYYLGNNWKNRVEHYGAKPGYDSEGVIIL